MLSLANGAFDSSNDVYNAAVPYDRCNGRVVLCIIVEGLWYTVPECY